MRPINLLSLLALLMMCTHGYSQAITNKGTEFWVSYGHHQFMESGSNSQEMVLYLSNTENVAAKVRVEIYGTANPPFFPQSWFRSYTIPPNSVIQTETTQAEDWYPKNASNTGIGAMPKTGSYDTRLYVTGTTANAKGGSGKFDKKGIRIYSTNGVPIVAYSHIYGSASSGATMLLPTNAWGYNYTSINSNQQYASNCFSWMYIVAKDNDTKIELTPSVKTQSQEHTGLQPNVTSIITLQRGQVYQILGANINSDADGNGGTSSTGYELTGTTVKSIPGNDGICKKIAVFSGSSRTGNPASCGGSSGDNDMQQGFPEHTWGKQYLTAPLSVSSNASSFQTNSYKIVVKDPSTVVRVNGTVLPPPSGKFYYYESSTPDLITADKPIAVAQFMTSCLIPTGLGDPEMVYLSPVEQGIKKIGFYRNTKENISVNYLTLIIPTTGLSSLKIDGSNNAWDYAYAHPNFAGYSVVIKRWNAAQAVTKVESNEKFNAVTYGLGSVESYAFNAGTNLENIAGSSVKNVPDTSTAKESPFNCTNTPTKISAVLDFTPTKITWLLSEVPQLGNASDYTMINPVPVVDGNSFIYTLPNAQTFSSPGDYSIRIVTENPLSGLCSSSDTFALKITVRDKPTATFNYDPHSGCPSDSMKFHGPLNTGSGTNIIRWNWIFEPNKKDSVREPSYLFPIAGTYNVALMVVAEGGCLSDTSKQDIVVNAPSPPSFSISKSEICEGDSIIITPGPESTTEWYWDFGDGRKDTLTVNTPFSIKMDSAGIFDISASIKLPGNCASSGVATHALSVYGNPVISFNYPQGCLPSDGNVQFKDLSTIPDSNKQSINSWLWNFGDPNASGNNANTSTSKNPSHIYEFGSYNLNLTVATNKGCSSDSSWTDTFKISPLVSFAAIDPVCQNITPYSIASKVAITNNVPGSGYFSGNGVDSSGLFDPALAGPGTHTITYTFTSDGGCVQTAQQDINVFDIPEANFSFADSCLSADGKMTFTNLSTIGAGETITSYTWDFGDGNTSSDQNPVHYYNAEGSYQVKLSTASNFGCTHDTTMDVNVKIKPALTFSALSDVCSNEAIIDLSSKVSVSGGMAGNGAFSGNGINGNNFDPAAAGPGNHTIQYAFTSAGGCVSTATQNILVKAVPRPTFTFPSGCLSDDGLVQFNNTTVIAQGATIQSWNWNFGDNNASGSNPNTSQLKDPTHRYLEGTYTITLQSAYTNGCSGDTSATVAFNTLPKLGPVPGVNAVCEDNAGTITLTAPAVTNAVPMASQNFSGPGITNASQGIFDPAVAGAGVHTIQYTYTSPAGCAASASFTVEVYPKPVASFTVNKASVCLNEPISFTNTSTIAAGHTITKWEWSFDDGSPVKSDNTAPAPFTHTYSNDGVYHATLKVISAKGCAAVSTPQNITINPLPAIEAMQLPEVICMPTGKAQFNAAASIKGGGTLSYLWNFGDGQTSTQKDPLITYTTAAPPSGYNISLEVKSAAGCMASQQKPLNNFFNQPTAKFTTAENLCQGNASQFTNQSVAGTAALKDYIWNFGDGSGTPPLTTKNPSKTYSKPGTYTVSLQVKDEKGCTAASPYTMEVTVHLQPKVDAGPGLTLKQGEYGQFKPVVNDSANISLKWSTEAGKPSGIVDPNVVSTWVKAITDDTWYYLTGIGQNNCTATDSALVKVLKAIKIPNAFSPNGDGVNDLWLIEGLKDYPGHSVTVFNRAGQEVFTSYNYQVPWNGKYKSQDLPVGTYYYIIDPKNGLPPITGWLFISR